MSSPPLPQVRRTRSTSPTPSSSHTSRTIVGGSGESSTSPTLIASQPKTRQGLPDPGQAISKKREHEKLVRTKALERKFQVVKSVANQTVSRLSEENQQNLLNALLRLPEGYRICSNTSGVDVAFSDLVASTGKAITTVEEAKEKGFSPYDGDCIPWRLHEIGTEQEFSGKEIVFWIQGALKHVNLITMKFRGYPHLAVKAGVASSQQVHREVRANLSPPDHGDMSAMLTSDMVKKDSDGMTWQAVCRIHVLNDDLLCGTHDEIRKQFDLVVDWNKLGKRRTYDMDLKVYDRTWVGKRPRGCWPSQQRGSPDTVRDIDVAIMYGAHTWHLDIDHTTGEEVVWPVSRRVHNGKKIASGRQPGPGQIKVQLLNIQNQVEHVFGSEYRHDVNPNYLMRWHGQKDLKDRVGDVH